MSEILLKNGKTMVSTGIYMPKEEVEQARMLGINVTAVSRKALRREIRKCQNNTRSTSD